MVIRDRKVIPAKQPDQKGTTEMQIDLSGKLAIITGVGKGIGRAIVRTLAEEGMTTVALDVSESDLAEVGDELAGLGVHRQYQVDIRDSARIDEVIRAVRDEFGQIDVLVNNAGVGGNGPIESLSEEVWDFSHDVNLKGTFLMCKAVIPTMKEQKRGRIINAASFAAIVPSIGSVAYATSKAAVAHFTRGLAGELGPWNITVNAYAPGMIPTTLNHFAELPQEQQDRLLDTLSLREWGSKEDIANLICFLASDQARYITGTLIDISGGKLATQIPRVAYDNAAAAGEYTF
ncbi:SDR family NAD(P)-dependent oxidoreductase [Cryobacterium sp. BB307]|uniref:SDR family NAD(P)-dependent oxidoreductase n=1 Tax=unclassified Cryobacterium TaxID=2649013 RepID=UPI0032C01601